MEKKKRSLTLLLICILSFLLLILLVHTFPPSFMLHIYTFSFPILIPFFLLLFFVFFGLGGFITRNKIQGIVGGSFIVVVGLLRLFTITHWFFMVLLLLLFIIVEIIIYQNR